MDTAYSPRASGALAGLVAAGAVIVVAALGLSGPRGPAVAPLPPLAAIDEPDARKTAFIDYLYPVILEVTDEILAERRRVVAISAAHARHGGISRIDQWWLAERARQYRISDATPEGQLARLERRLDVVPPSLALAQAAIESGWGTSRFAVEGNNLFGHWCFVEGCGLVPDRRPAGARHEVAVFDSTTTAVRRYLYNLNTHRAYRPLRDLRAEARSEGRPLSGLELAGGLARYSERGQPYVRDVRIVIRANDLESLDTQWQEVNHAH